MIGGGFTERKKIIKFALLGACLLIFIASAIVIAVRFAPEKNPYAEYKNDTQSKDVSDASSEETVELVDNPVNFEALHSETTDACAWIHIDGTVIDYPVMQSPEDKDQNFYLSHDPSGKAKRAGSIYIQKFNNGDFTDPNTVIYGHNMLNGSMFAALKKYRNRTFFDEHPTITVYTPGHILTYRIFSAFVFDDRHILGTYDFNNPVGFDGFLHECLEPTSAVRNIAEDVTVTKEDRLITLSTCTSAEKERYLVVAKLVDDVLTK